MKTILSIFFKKSLLYNKKKYLNIFFKKSYKNKIIKKIIYKNINFFKSFIKKYYKKTNKIKKIRKIRKIKKIIKNGNETMNNNENIISYENININEIIVKFCVFLGREKNMKILHFYIEQSLKNDIINEYHMFDFSRNNNDHLFIYNEFNRLNSIYQGKIYLHNYDDNEIILKKARVKTNWSPFYKTISKWSKNSVVIKCDDDILFIDINSLKNAIKDRIKDKISFLIHSNCINNGVCAYYQKDLFKNLNNELNKHPIGGINGVLFEKPELAYVLHNQFCKDLLMDMNNINKYIINNVFIDNRISINFILINGNDLKYLENITFHDEYELSSLLPEKLLRPNKIKGDFITSHLSYTFQDKILLNRPELLFNYQKIANNYIFKNKINFNNIRKYTISKFPIPKAHYINDIFKIKNFITENNYYIKCTSNNKYLYIDYEEDLLKLSNEAKTIFNINQNLNNDNIEINLGIYYITLYNTIGKFKNENIYFKYFKDEKEKMIIKENIDEKNEFYLKFYKYNNYLFFKNNDYIDVSLKPTAKWTFEKVQQSEFIFCKRYIKNNKFYYQNIENNDIYTNFYLGWAINGLLW